MTTVEHKNKMDIQWPLPSIFPLSRKLQLNVFPKEEVSLYLIVLHVIFWQFGDWWNKVKARVIIILTSMEINNIFWKKELLSQSNFCPCHGKFYRILVTLHSPPMSNHLHYFHLVRKKKILENLHDTMTNQNILLNSVKILDYC